MQTRSVVWVDFTGSRTITRLNTSAGAGTIMADIVACSGADQEQWWESAVTFNGSPAPAGGPYQPITMRAALTFVCADNTQVVLIIPSPALAIFKADGETVDPTATPVAALIAACIGNLESSTGSVAATYVSGTLLTNVKVPVSG